MKTHLPLIITMAYAVLVIAAAKKFPPSEQKVMDQPYRVTCQACEKVNNLKPYDLTSSGSRSTTNGYIKETTLWFKCTEKGCKAKFTRHGPEIFIHAETVKAVPVPAPVPTVYLQWSNNIVVTNKLSRPKNPRIVAPSAPPFPGNRKSP